MQKFKLPVLIVIIVGITAVFYARSVALDKTIQSTAKPNQPIEPTRLLPDENDCIPTFSDGGGPYYQANSPFREALAPENNSGESLVVSGRVLESDCTTPMPNVVLDIWQANETGDYEDEWYRGRVTTNENGEYRFTTVVPKGYGQGTGYRPPHIHFKVWEADQLLITSQMFLPESSAQGINEAYIIEVTSELKDQEVVHYGKHEVVVP